MDRGTLEFEAALTEELLNLTEMEGGGDIKTYISLARSFDDLASKAIGADIPRIIGGVSIVYAYVLIMLGGFDCVQQKVCTYVICIAAPPPWGLGCYSTHTFWQIFL